MSKPTFLLVDGHSLLHSWAELRRLHRDHPRHARNELAARLARYADASGERVVIVFDGQGETSEEPRRIPGLQVFYSGSGKTADDVIERLVVKYADRYELTVATEDLAERTTVEASGAWTTGTAGLVERVHRAEAGLAEKIKRLRGGNR